MCNLFGRFSWLTIENAEVNFNKLSLNDIEMFQIKYKSLYKENFPKI